MKLLDLIRMTKGYVTFKAVGGFSERFINLCAKSQVGIFDIKYIDSHIEGKISARRFKSLRSIAKKTGVKITVIRKDGAAFIIRRNRHRVALMLGACFFAVFVIVMNRFLWCIDASGSEKFSSEQIIETAQNLGVRQGVFVPFFDEKKAAREIYKAYSGELSWVSVNVKGSRASISVRDANESKGEDPQDNSPCNIVADFDGVILSDETLSGIKNINKGNAVKKGDLLISGVIENEDSSTVYYKAKGKFTAIHDTFDETAVFYDEKRCFYTKSESYICLHFFGLDIPLKIRNDKNDQQDTFSYSLYARFAGMNLPFGFSRIYSVKFENLAVTKDRAYIYAADEYLKDCYEKYKNTNILNCGLKIKADNKAVTISGEHHCIDFMGKEQPILTENMKSK